MGETTLQRFGDRLRYIRTSKAISQEDLAGKAGLNRTYISLLERGKRNPSLLCIANIAAALDVDLHDLSNLNEPKI